MKNAQNLIHTSSTRNEDDIAAMIAAYGAKGYGFYWIIAEVMMGSERCSIDTSLEYWLPTIAKQMGCSKQDAMKFINSCVNDFNLFEIQGYDIFIPSLKKEKDKIHHKSQQARSAAKARWSKEPKKKTVKKAQKGIKVLQDSELWGKFKGELLAEKQFKQFTVESLESERNKCIDYLKSRNKKYKDYKAMFRNWLRSPYNKPKGGRAKDGMIL